MSIPDYQTCMLPLLKFYSDGMEHTFREAVREKPLKVDVDYLGKFEAFNAFRALRHTKLEEELDRDSDNKTPEELLERAHQKLRTDLVADLLQRLRTCSPSFFERLVVDVIVKMGYGGTRKDAGKAVGKVGLAYDRPQRWRFNNRFI